MINFRVRSPLATVAITNCKHSARLCCTAVFVNYMCVSIDRIGDAPKAAPPAAIEETSDKRRGRRVRKSAAGNALRSNIMATTTNTAAQKPANSPMTAAPQAFREMAEKGTTQAKETYEKMNAATAEAADLIKNSISTAVNGAQDYNTK